MTHTSLCFRRQAGIQSYKRNKSHLPAQKWHEHQKVFPNSIKPALYFWGHRKNKLQCAENRIDLDFAKVFPENWEIHLFNLPLLYKKSFNDDIANYLRKISIYSKLGSNTYDNIDSFMNFTIDMHNFSKKRNISADPFPRYSVRHMTTDI